MNLDTDEKGYLVQRSDWSRAVAVSMADADGVSLEQDHWAVIEFFRNYFEEFEIEPPMRVLVQWARETLGGEKGSSRYLYKLFPDGPVIQASRYGGLPRPASCI